MEDFGASSYHRYLEGDADALNDIVREYGDSLVRFAHAFLGDTAAAEDVMEDTFAVLIVKRKKFDERAKFGTYLFSIARNKCLDILRVKKRYAPLNEDILHVGDLESDVILSEKRKVVRENMRYLPKDYRLVLELVYFDEFTIEQASVILRKNRKQIYNLLYRAKSALKEILYKAGFDYEDQ